MFGIREESDNKLIMSFDMNKTELTIVHKRVYNVGGRKITCYICKDKEGQLYIADTIYSEGTKYYTDDNSRPLTLGGDNFCNYNIIKGYKIIDTEND